MPGCILSGRDGDGEDRALTPREVYVWWGRRERLTTRALKEKQAKSSARQMALLCRRAVQTQPGGVARGEGLPEEVEQHCKAALQGVFGKLQAGLHNSNLGFFYKGWR